MEALSGKKPCSRGNAKYCICIMLIYALYILSRFLFLDSDVMPFTMSNIDPMDEIYYNQIGWNIADQGLLFSLTHGVGPVCVPNAKTYLVSNILVAITCSLLGKTYYALRTPTVLLGLFSMYLIQTILNDVLQDSKYKKKIIILTLLLYTTDFTLLMLTRSSITVTPCMTAELLLFFAMVKLNGKRRRQSLALGFLSTVSLCIVYMGVPFFILASGLFVVVDALIQTRKFKEVIINAALFGVGIILGILFSDLCSRVFLKQNIIEILLATLAGHGEKINTAPTLHTILVAMFSFFESNLFRYDSLLLFLLAASVLIELFRKKRSPYCLFAILLIFSHWLQNIPLNNMTASKTSISAGAVLLLAAMELEHLIGETAGRDSAEIPVWKRVIALAAFLLLTLFCAWRGGWSNGFSNRTVLILQLSVWYQCFVFILCAFDLGSIKRHVVLALLPAIVFSAALGYRKLFAHPTYDDLILCKSLNEFSGEKLIGWDCAFALYNDIDPVFSYYDRYSNPDIPDYTNEKMHEYTNSSSSFYLLDYTMSPEQLEKFNEAFADTPYKYEQVLWKYRTYYAWVPEDSAVAVYKKVLK